MQNRRQLLLFFAATICLAATGSISDSVFNNFLHDTFHIEATGRGALELPREMPGFLVVVMAGALAAIPVTQVGVIGAGTLALGLVGLMFLGGHWYPMVAMMVLASTGLHLMMPVGSSIAIGLGGETKRGQRMGQVDALGSLGTIVATGSILVLFRHFGTHYSAATLYNGAFLAGAMLAVVAAVIYSRMHVPHLHARRPRLVMRWKYSLYYSLELLFGARKQIFITFGPWVLITIYGQEASAIAGLYMIAAVIGLGFKPLMGYAIDRFGERFMLASDGAVLIFVCLGYGFARELTSTADSARLLACTCFVLDSLLFTIGSARAIYLSRIIHSPEELTSTLSMGVSINHVVSMTIPLVAGALWVWAGYQTVFVGAACLSAIVSINALRIPRRDVLRGPSGAAS
jgi:MFS family permease